MTDEQNPGPASRPSGQTTRNRWVVRIGALLAVVYILLAIFYHQLIAAALTFPDDDYRLSIWAFRLALIAAAIIPATLVTIGTEERRLIRIRRRLLFFLIFAGLPYLLGGATIDFS